MEESQTSLMEQMGPKGDLSLATPDYVNPLSSMFPVFGAPFGRDPDHLSNPKIGLGQQLGMIPVMQ